MSKLYRMIIYVLVLSFISMKGMLIRLDVYAKSTKTEVVQVRNEKQMIKQLVSGMGKQQRYFAFSYKGVKKDFRKYKRQDCQFQTFWKKVARRDGYRTGILSCSCMYLVDGERPYLVIQLGYLTTKKQEKEIDRRIKRFVSKRKSESTYEQIRQTHDYLIENMMYCDGYINPYDGLVKGKGICMSYALLFQRFMQEFGIPCRYVRGDNHAWNKVQLHGKWYNIDVTWDDNCSNPYRYFLKLDNEFTNH